MDARQRLQTLQEQRLYMRLFALVDGFVYHRLHGRSLEHGSGCVPLFADTPDAALASSGPWLVDIGQMAELDERLRAHERGAAHVSWLLAELPFEGLIQLLRLKLDARMPDGSTALLRFYDPRVLHGLVTVMTPAQREEFFGHIHEWHFFSEGQYLRVGRGDA